MNNTIALKNENPRLNSRYLELEKNMAKHLMTTLNHLMVKKSVFKNENLTPTLLSRYLKISKHQLSELLNVHYKIGFYDYINSYRLNYSIKLLNDSNCQLTILDIAFESGFNNKSSFYRLFKMKFNITPIEYKNKIIAT